jgi:hypothetical protein
MSMTEPGGSTNEREAAEARAAVAFLEYAPPNTTPEALGDFIFDAADHGTNITSDGLAALRLDLYMVLNTNQTARTPDGMRDLPRKLCWLCGKPSGAHYCQPAEEARNRLRDFAGVR